MFDIWPLAEKKARAAITQSTARIIVPTVSAPVSEDFFEGSQPGGGAKFEGALDRGVLEFGG